MPEGRQRYFDNNGVSASGGLLYTYAAGTTVPKAVYTDAAGTIPHPNPIQLDSKGEAVIFWNGAYKVDLKTSDGLQVTGYPVDNINTDPAGLWTMFTTLISAAGANLIGYLPGGAGAVLTTVQNKLRNTLIARNDYGSDVQFNTAVASSPYVPSLDILGNFKFRTTPLDEGTQLASGGLAWTVCSGPRDALVYASASTVKVCRSHAVMGGFRYRGQYTRGRAPVYPLPANRTVSVIADQAAMGGPTFENWYAVFACANPVAATASLKCMPFVRVGSMGGAVANLVHAGEGQSAPAARTYGWTANSLAGTQCLIISEGGNWSGRVATITANTQQSITLDVPGAVAAGDFLLPAPPGFAHYCYLASFYLDTAEVRNIYDTGTLVKAKMIYLLTPSAANSGSVPAPGATFNCAGYICPLATGVVMDSSLTCSTTQTGTYAEYYDPDGSSHIVQTSYREKTAVLNETFVFPNISVPFQYFQKFNYYNAGDPILLANRIGGQLNITGWIEP